MQPSRSAPARPGQRRAPATPGRGGAGILPRHRSSPGTVPGRMPITRHRRPPRCRCPRVCSRPAGEVAPANSAGLLVVRHDGSCAPAHRRDRGTWARPTWPATPRGPGAAHEHAVRPARHRLRLPGLACTSCSTPCASRASRTRCWCAVDCWRRPKGRAATAWRPRAGDQPRRRRQPDAAAARSTRAPRWPTCARRVGVATPACGPTRPALLDSASGGVAAGARHRQRQAGVARQPNSSRGVVLRSRTPST